MLNVTLDKCEEKKKKHKNSSVGSVSAARSVNILDEFRFILANFFFVFCFCIFLWDWCKTFSVQIQFTTNLHGTTMIPLSQLYSLLR